MCHSPRSDGSACSDDGNVHVLEQPEFLHIALQIAAGKYNFFLYCSCLRTFSDNYFTITGKIFEANEHELEEQNSFQ
jgi:hypothetical protein